VLKEVHFSDGDRDRGMFGVVVFKESGPAHFVNMNPEPLEFPMPQSPVQSRVDEEHFIPKTQAKTDEKLTLSIMEQYKLINKSKSEEVPGTAASLALKNASRMGVSDSETAVSRPIGPAADITSKVASSVYKSEPLAKIVSYEGVPPDVMEKMIKVATLLADQESAEERFKVLGRIKSKEAAERIMPFLFEGHPLLPAFESKLMELVNLRSAHSLLASMSASADVTSSQVKHSRFSSERPSERIQLEPQRHSGWNFGTSVGEMSRQRSDDVTQRGSGGGGRDEFGRSSSGDRRSDDRGRDADYRNSGSRSISSGKGMLPRSNNYRGSK
jgi:hypothetical protein